MATIHLENFEPYGTVDEMLDGIYAETTVSSLDTVDDRRVASVGGSFGRFARYVLPATVTTLYTAGRFLTETLPTVEARGVYLQVRDNSNAVIATVWPSTTGQLVASAGTPGGTEYGRTAGPVISAGVWHHIEIEWVQNATTGSIKVRMDDGDTEVLSLTGLNLGSNAIAQAVFGSWVPGGTSTGAPIAYWTDLHYWDTSGTRNTGFLGDITIATLWANEDVETGWTPNYRHKIADGILDLRASSTTAVVVQDAASLELGSGDYTLETFVRFNVLPTTTERHTIFCKWMANNNTRSWRLSKCGPSLNSGHIEFDISTDGTAGTVQTIHSYPWEPETDRWYHVAVVRSAGENMLFIDGIMQNVPQADAYTYADNNSRPFIGAEGAAVQSTVTNTRVNGWLDETRWTRGVARYTENFTPTTVPFGRNSTDDPDFADVVLLCGWDLGLVDESSYARAISEEGSPEATTPDDGDFQYQTINQEDSPTGVPRDDTYISASYYRAAAILTLGSVPLDTETVTVGTQAYTFVNTLVNAYDVLIGADIEVTLQNLAAAINDSGGEGTIYGTGTDANADCTAEEMVSPQMKVLAVVAGTAGNSIAVSDTLTDGAWDDTTLTGGADIPGPSSFYFTRLPLDVTTVRSVMALTRAYKTDAGTAKMRTNFIGPVGGETLGTEVSLTVNPAYRTEVFELDPDTSGPITPSTLLTGRIRFNRTE